MNSDTKAGGCISVAILAQALAAIKAARIHERKGPFDHDLWDLLMTADAHLSYALKQLQVEVSQ